ncbi:MAG: recombination mediator RecR [Calditrichota bacterium]|jgi:recombination protein RecR
MNGKIIPPALDDLIEELTRLPGIGRKTATRLAFHLLKTPDNHAQNLANAIVRMKSKVHLCPICFNLTENDLCNICNDQTRNKGQICVVEDSESLLMIEKTNQYNGLYHVLGGVISPLDGIGADDLNVKSLFARLDSVEEVILALNPSTEGEATTIYLARLIKPLHIKVTRLARGIPLGGHLEFVDGLTLSKALESRDEI